MRYDEYCFERGSYDSEVAYLNQDFSEEIHRCSDCGEEATIYKDGEWLCEECEEERWWFKKLNKIQ